jgi:hypothetical protein
MPLTAGALAACLRALASDSRGGTDPPLDAATAIAVPPAMARITPATMASRRWVETVRRNLMAITIGQVLEIRLTVLAWLT